MKNILSNLKWIPEFYFIMVSLLWFYLSVRNQDPNYQSIINFPAVILIVIFHIQLFLNDSILGKVLAAITALASIYIIINFSYRFMNFSSFDYNSQIFTLKLGNLVLLNFIMAYLMYIKYNKQRVEAEISE